MSKDFYQILGVSKSSSEDDIKKAYRKQALKWHPDRHQQPEKKKEAEAKFKDIGEAFEVLSDKEKRRVYDLGGMEGVKAQEAGANPFPSGGGHSGRGMGGMGGGFPGGSSSFSFTSNGASGGGGMDPSEIFKNFFGTGDPFAAEMGGGGGGGNGGFRMGGMGGMPFPQAQSHSQSHAQGMGMPMGGGQHNHHKPKVQPIVHELRVSLEDLYNGTSKKVRITRKRKNVDDAIEKVIPVKAGWKDGTKVTFEREGNDAPNSEPGDITFVIVTKPHAHFKREGDDLIYTCNVTLQESLCGVHSTVQTLDGRTLPIQAYSVTPETTLRLANEGMMNCKSKRRGDLLVNFLIKFPILSDSQRQQIGQIIKGGSSNHNK